MWKANLCFALAFACIFVWMNHSMKKCDNVKIMKAALAIQKQQRAKKK